MLDSEDAGHRPVQKKGEKKRAELSAQEGFMSHTGNGATICLQMPASPRPVKLAVLVWEPEKKGF